MSMNGLCESHCPICRHPYYHFPTVCQMLHALLLKMYPVTYKRREKQTLEEEEKMGFFSPNFDDLGASHAKEESCNINVQSSIASNQDNGCGASSTAGGIDDSLLQTSSNDISPTILIADVLCATCKQLLFRPAVLNCGHVYCENCLVPADGPLSCQICQSPHPRGIPKVYLELDHFIEEFLKEEYALRKDSVQVKQVHSQHENQANGSAEEGEKGIKFPGPSDENFLYWCADNGSKVHFGAGCDYCGMFPIIGDRYRCKDCKEAIGFDLCGECYNTTSKLPGRFNQQHTSDHQFECVKLSTFYNMILRVLRGQSENGGPRLQDPVPENDENIFAPWVVPINDENSNQLEDPVTGNEENNLPPWIIRQNAENDVLGPSTPGLTENDHDKDDDTPSIM